jgi:regulator of sirC expression with transglutaminase-like and TPR domain
MSVGQYDKAIADFTQTINLGDIYCLLDRGSAYARIGNKCEAIADFEDFLRLSEDPELVEEVRQEVEKLHNL